MGKNEGASSSGFHFLQDYLRCQQYFYWKYFRKLEPLWASPSLLFGDAIHKALEAWYIGLRDGMTTPERHLLAVQAFRSRLGEIKDSYKYTETFLEDRDRGKRIIDAYALEYAFEAWKVLDIERGLEYTFETGDKFTGRFDLAVTTHQGRQYIVDHKTTGWGMANLIKTLNATDQSTGYLWLWNNTAPDYMRANGIIFNIIRSYKDSIDFKQHLVTKSDADLDRFKKDAGYTLEEIATKVTDPNRFRFVRNTASCYLYNRPCPYLDLCMGANYEGLIGTMYKPIEEVA